MCISAKKRKETPDLTKQEEFEKIIEEGCRMLAFISENTTTQPKIFESQILERIFGSASDNMMSVFQLCATIILHLGLNPENQFKLTEENIAKVVCGLVKKDNYFVQMDLLTVIKILMTSNLEKLRAVAAKAYLDSVIATTTSSKYTNVIAICGFILQYY